MRKKSMSVMEMGRMLGFKKTNSYWLIKKAGLKRLWSQARCASWWIALRNGIKARRITGK